jgi:hypothetical protein
MRTATLLVSTLVLGAAPASAQLASALLREGDSLPSLPSHTVTSISNTATDQNGGFAVTISSSDGGTTLSHVWGAIGGGPGVLLRTESTIGSLQQDSFESFFGISAGGSVAYSPSCQDTLTGATGLDGVWVDGTVIALEDDPIPMLPGSVWRFASRPGITATGTVYFVGGIDDATTGSSQGNGLFIGNPAVPVLKTGDVIAGLPAAVGTSAADFDSRMSLLGTHWISVTDTDASTSADNYPLIDGAVVVVAGNTIGEGQPIPASSGGMPGENWDNFDYLGINEAGDFLLTGDTDASSSVDEFVSKNGVILWREGDVVDGETLTGSIEGAYMNENGQIAYIWDVVGPSTLEALFFEDRLLLKEGDEVDWDGDGAVDAGAVVTDFTGISALTLGLEPALFFTADIVVPGLGTLEGFFRIDYDGMAADVHGISLASGGTQTISLDAGPVFSGQTYWVLGTVTGTSPGLVFGGAFIPLNFDAYTNVTINSPNLGLLGSTLGTLDGAGRATSTITLPPASDPSLAGVDVHHAFVVIDLGLAAILSVGGPLPLALQP